MSKPVSKPVSILVPIRNEAQYIQRCLDAIAAQDHPELECWIIDGMSDDNTRSLIAPYLEKHPWMHVLDNPERTAPYALNYGLEKATGEVIIRVDGHCEIASDYVSSCLRVMEESGADCVGGPLVSQGDSARAEAIAMAMSSPFGVGNARFRYSQQAAWVDTLAFGAYRRVVFDTVGSFNPELTRNQDDEFNYRVREAGFLIYLSPEIRAVYYTRGSFKKLWQQYAGYGLWKVRVMKAYPKSIQMRHLVPGLFVAGLSGSTALTLIAMLFQKAGQCHRAPQLVKKGPLLLKAIVYPYALLGLLMGVKRTKKQWRYLPDILLSFPILHLAYGSGFWQGVWQSVKRS